MRRIELGALRVSKRAGRPALDVLVANRGNVAELLRGARTVVVRDRDRTPLAMVVARSRELRPRTRGILEFPLPARFRGRTTARIVIPSDGGRSAVRRSYRIRL